MIRIFSHYVSKTAFILLLLEILILLLSATLTSMLWLADGSRVLRVGEIYLSSTIFALVIVLSMSALGMYQHRSREDIRNTAIARERELTTAALAEAQGKMQVARADISAQVERAMSELRQSVPSMTKEAVSRILA